MELDARAGLGCSLTVIRSSVVEEAVEKRFRGLPPNRQLAQRNGGGRKFRRQRCDVIHLRWMMAK